MEAIRPNWGKTLIVGVDLGSETNYAIFTTLSEDERMNKKRSVFTFSHSREGYDSLLVYVNAEKERLGCEETEIGFESTGCYGLPFLLYLNEYGIKMKQVNPAHTKKAKSFDDNSPLKTDKKDPRVIANLMKLGKCMSVIIPEGNSAELRSMSKYRDQLVTEQTRLKNQLHTTLFEVFPEYESIFDDVSCKTSLRLLKNSPLPSDLVSRKLKPFGKYIHKISRGRFGLKTAVQLKEKARDTVGTKYGWLGYRLRIQYDVDRLLELAKKLEEVEDLITKELAKIDYSDKLQSIPGVGPIHAASLIGEVGDFRNFSTQSEILKVAGLNLYEVSSGKHKGRIKISKHGRSGMRRTLYLASLNMIRKGGIYTDYYQKLVGSGKPKMKAVIAVCRKLLCLIFALVRDNTVYNRDYKQTNLKLITSKVA